MKTFVQRALLPGGERQDWPTPQYLFDELDAEFRFTLDPCASPENAKCERYFTQADNGLAKSWAGERVFMNPPYGRDVGVWVRKAWLEARENGALVVCLIPARTDTGWWHDYCMTGEVRFIRGRVKFGNGGRGHNAPFPSAIVVFDGRSVGARTGMMFRAVAKHHAPGVSHAAEDSPD